MVGPVTMVTTPSSPILKISLSGRSKSVLSAKSTKSCSSGRSLSVPIGGVGAGGGMPGVDLDLEQQPKPRPPSNKNYDRDL